ncbi:cytochrome P450 [Streptomyces caatingaensis]|uniref:cytochrome P450 n=1 Tax=Streptomyces caatingaensis TaxID=1678637 RepID=UPI001F51F4F9|nr:cytochrome P450 [Streptomyces caatingaensis]
MPREGDGFWAVVRHEDIVTVSRQNKVFIAGAGVLFEDIPEGGFDGSLSILAMDHPRHTKLRRLISSAFTLKSVARLKGIMEALAGEVVDELAACSEGRADFVEKCSSLFPMRVISETVGISGDRRDDVVAAAIALVAATPDTTTEDGFALMKAAVEGNRFLRDMALDLAARRRAHPTDDIMTVLVQAESEGERLTDTEIVDLFVLLCIAGYDSTRQTINHGLKLLTDLPEQRDWLMEDLEGRMGSAVEEILRYATPVMTFRRTAAIDTELGGQTVKAGEKVVMFYASGNRDGSVFPDPGRFDLSRDPNPHLTFGGGGAHFCLAAQLARGQLRALFGTLLRRLPDIEAGEPEYKSNSSIDGIRRLPCRFTPQ